MVNYLHEALQELNKNSEELDNQIKLVYDKDGWKIYQPNTLNEILSLMDLSDNDKSWYKHLEEKRGVLNTPSHTVFVYTNDDGRNFILYNQKSSSGGLYWLNDEKGKKVYADEQGLPKVSGVRKIFWHDKLDRKR